MENKMITTSEVQKKYGCGYGQALEVMKICVKTLESQGKKVLRKNREYQVPEELLNKILGL